MKTYLLGVVIGFPFHGQCKHSHTIHFVMTIKVSVHKYMIPQYIHLHAGVNTAIRTLSYFQPMIHYVYRGNISLLSI